MANFVYIATSLDGFIADSNGGLDWLMNVPNPEGSDFGFAEFMERVDGLIMGRNTFEKVLTFGEWPYNKKVFVLSNSLTNIDDKLKDKVEIINGKLKALLKELNERGFSNLYIDGGRVIQNFMNEDLIDEMIITRVPVLLGSGIPLFGKLLKPINFSKVETTRLTEILVKSHYIK